MKSNRAVGNAFEQELCECLFGYGYWVKNLKQDNAGQPADVIAVRNGQAYLIDAKDCAKDTFDLRRVEDNQITAMQLWEECGNGQGWFAFRIRGDIWFMPCGLILAWQQYHSALTFDEIYHMGLPLERWVAKCK